MTFVSANNHYEVDDLKIQTLLSTDAGVAFYVNVRGVSIFHAEVKRLEDGIMWENL